MALSRTLLPHERAERIPGVRAVAGSSWPSRAPLFTPTGHEDRIGTFFNGSFGCDDVHYTYAQLKERGVEFEEEPQEQPWGTYAIFKDVDGNSFVLGSK